MTLRTTDPARTPGISVIENATTRVRRPRLRGALAYLALGAPVGLVGVLLPLVLTVAGIGTALVWIGFPVLVLATSLWRGFAAMERRWMRFTLGVTIPSPYRPRPDTTLFRRWRARLRDPATWRDIAYLVLRLPLCLVEFVVTLVLWAYSLALMLLPIYAPLLPPAEYVHLPNLAGHLLLVHTVSQTLPYAGVGVLFVALSFLVTPSFAQFQAVIAAALLGPTRAAELTIRAAELAVKADHLQASRARGVDAAEAERRRIERDLHDGAQQRLVAVAIALGRAKNKLADDPDSARLLIEEAHADAKQAVAELRDLARGIYPAVLGDRGLDAALSALAARCPVVPVRIEVDALPRPPAAVETTAYFIVAETLTNLAKHSTATEATVIVRRIGNTVTVRVVDNGEGGAALRVGGGLAGLADRAATIDGVMSVSSPPGGPTVITAELPCEW